MFRHWLINLATLSMGMFYALRSYLQCKFRKIIMSSTDVGIDNHLKAAIDWLLIAHQVVDGNGFSASFNLRAGWGQSYPETTGYLIPTIINFTQKSDYRRTELIDACHRSGKWLLSIQHPSGAFPGYGTDKPIIFDTGQVLLGLCAVYQFNNDVRYLNAAKQAGDWLCSQQEDNGSWLKFTYNNLPHAYHALVSVALLKLAELSSNDIYKESAIRNLDWTINQQLPNGWYKNSGFKAGNQAVLHTVAYTLQGLLLAGINLQNSDYIESAKKAADVLLATNQKSVLAGFYNDNWQSVDSSRCLTGLAQMGLVWHGLFIYTQDQKYLVATQKVFDYIMTKHNIVVPDVNLRGAIAGSCPIWGRYLPLAYPNWAGKFFIDLGLLME